MIYCSLIYVTLKREARPAVQRFFFGTNRLIDDQEFYFVLIGYECPGDAFFEMGGADASHNGIRLKTMWSLGHRASLLVAAEPMLLSGAVVASARRADSTELHFTGVENDDVFFKDVGPYAGGFLRDLAALNRELLAEGTEDAE